MPLADLNPESLPPRPITPNPGGQLAAADVVGRKTAVDQALKLLLDEGRHLILDEPRRFGKSSVARLLVATIETTDHSAVYLSVQGDTTVKQVVGSILGALRDAPGNRSKSIKRVLLSYLTEINLGPIGLTVAHENDPLAALRSSMGAIDSVLQKDGTVLVVCLDELTETVGVIANNEGNDSAKELLAELRRIRETHTNIRWVLTGSVGFHHVLRQIGSTESPINDVKQFILGPLSIGWAMWLAESVLLGANVLIGEGEDHTSIHSEIARVTDGIPILIHLIADRARDTNTTAIRVVDVQPMLDECFRNQDLSRNLTHFLSRLNDYLAEDAPTAEEVLDRAADAPLSVLAAMDSPGVTRALINHLEADHYLTRDSQNLLTWKYPSLARLWKLRRGRL